MFNLIKVFKKKKEKEVFIKKKYSEENVVFYLHFRGENAIRQIEVSPDKTIKLSESHPVDGENFLYDQNFSDIQWEPEDFISKEEFEKTWNKES